MRRSTLYAIAGLAAALVVGCGSEESTPVDPPAESPVVAVPEGFPAMPVPSDNALTADRIALGKRLFFDKRLSRTEEVSCGSCHLQEHAFADPSRVSTGIQGLTGTRNAPPLFNLAYNKSYFWDGGVPTLEKQALVPIMNPIEMNMTLGEVVDRVAADPSYVEQFRRAYGTAPSTETVAKGIASFMRSLVSGNSRYDRFNRGDAGALTSSEKRGRTIFFGEEGDCFHCHNGFNFTDNSIRSNGLYLEYQDRGRFLVTEKEGDIGKFKVPSLRNIALTAPYMHDGSMQTLEEVVEHYASGGKAHPNVDVTLRPLDLDAQERADLIAFLKALTDSTFITDARYRP